jgi:sulfate adenylyltransferase subunit 2
LSTLYNGRIRNGEHARVFPISNWTKLDVWECIPEEDQEAPSIHVARSLAVSAHGRMLYALSPCVELKRKGFF